MPDCVATFTRPRYKNETSFKKPSKLIQYSISLVDGHDGNASLFIEGLAHIFTTDCGNDNTHTLVSSLRVLTLSHLNQELGLFLGYVLP